MNVVFKIPKEFEGHYNRDRFADSLERIKEDLKRMNFKGLSGNYELETLEMLITEFRRSVPLGSTVGKIALNSIYGISAIYADTDKGFMKGGD